jgi:hypothetical protein
MSDYRVTCIRRDGPDRDWRIDSLGGDLPHPWKDTIDNVIQAIERQDHRLYTNVGGRAVWVVVRQHPTSLRKYLATEADRFPPNNLLSLPECPR